MSADLDAVGPGFRRGDVRGGVRGDVRGGVRGDVRGGVRGGVICARGTR